MPRYPTEQQVYQNEVALLSQRDAEFDKQRRLAKAGNRIGRSAPKSVNANIPRGLCPATECFLKQLSHPFNVRGERGIVGVGNIAATNSSFPVTTTSTVIANVPTLKMFELNIWPGHGIVPNSTGAAPVDNFSTHSMTQYIGGATPLTNEYMIGPLGGATVTKQAIGCYATGNTIGAASTVTSGAGMVPITLDTALPFTASEGASAHTRWRLVGMGIKFFNETRMDWREGTVTFVQTPMEYSDAAVTEFARFSPCYETTRQEDSVGGLEIDWLPTSEDLGYWHTEGYSGSTPAFAASGIGAAKFRLWFQNPSVNSQEVRVQIVQHWEIAGTNLSTLHSPSPTSSTGKVVVTESLNKVRAVSSVGSGLLKMGQHVAGQMVGAISSAAKDPRITQSAKALAFAGLKGLAGSTY